MQFSIHSGLSVAGVLAVYLPALLSAEVFRGRADSPRTIGRSFKLKSIDRLLNASSSNNATIDLSWRDTISFGAAHQSPAVAPPVVMPIFADSLADMSFKPNFKNISFGSVQRRDGALRCDTGDCVDGSCCSKDGICGYGPDFCGNGCRSLCNATAMCGEFSKDADVPCGMNLCCSATGWCGTTEVYCKNADPIHNTLPCQPGYGGCRIYEAPKCESSAKSAEGRKVGYYQSWNVRKRKCNSKTPKQLNTEGYTHLFYSFAFIDPTTFQVTPAHTDDKAMMKEFTGLAKPGGLQTWIAIGGFDFSNPGPTNTTWSDMVSTQENRNSFIDSVELYMKDNGFQGVDLDWEYPGEPKRGGREMADTRNFVTLVKQMRAKWGDKYGISLTLAPDYWYLRWFDAKAMEPSVDFFGFMAYGK
ncbi:hypothetical protein PVAG01_08993 [Phlyctema vagabunda]|uniref:chitinase n=1 Tax=Phlyctema vagabunda TaxID=108571 RepID=A0ABR4P630_9HELO